MFKRYIGIVHNRICIMNIIKRDIGIVHSTNIQLNVLNPLKPNCEIVDFPGYACNVIDLALTLLLDKK